jgi:lysophospholipase L1-like esterase
MKDTQDSSLVQKVSVSQFSVYILPQLLRRKYSRAKKHSADYLQDGSGDNSVHNRAKTAVPKYKPNLVLLNVGTNDGVQNIDLDNAGKRMEALLKTIYNSSPGVVVILSTLLPNRNSNERIEYINQQYRALVTQFIMDGYKIQ